MAAQASACGKVPIVNLDLVSGLARDAAAIEFLSRRSIRGIISTHQVPLRAARSLGLFAIQRTFLLDSAALQSSLRSIEQTRLDAIEVLPAIVAPYLVRELNREHSALPVIAGGLSTITSSDSGFDRPGREFGFRREPRLLAGMKTCMLLCTERQVEKVFGRISDLRDML